MKKINEARLASLLETRIGDAISEGRMGGTALAVYQNGRRVYCRCFDMTVPGGSVPVTERTIYRMASMTKPITAVAVLKLIEEGKLSLNDPIERYLPRYQNRRIGRLDEHGNLVDGGAVQTKPTVLHLLTHTSGIGSGEIGAKEAADMPDAAKHTLARAVDFYSRSYHSFEPFTTQQYSGLAGFDILARIVEVVSDTEFGEFVRLNVTDPCEMEDTTFTPSDAQWSRVIAMHDYRMGCAMASVTTPNCVFEHIPVTHPLGGAGLVSTLADYSNFAEMLRRGGEWNGNRILREETVRLMSSPCVPPQVQPGYKRWGLSVRVIVGEGYRVLPVGSFGWSGAYGTHFWVDPENQITAILLKNSRFDGGSSAKSSYHFEEDVHAAL